MPRLVLARRIGERVRLSLGGTEVWVEVDSINRNVVRLRFEAPESVLIKREEIIGEERKG